MDRRTFKKTSELPRRVTENPPQEKTKDNAAAPVLRGEGDVSNRLSALRELGAELQVKAERMRLLARAEEGLNEGEINPYTTVTISTFATEPVDNRNRVPAPSEQPSNIPVSIARQRRRLKQSKPKNKGNQAAPHSTVDIRHYKPGYVWNRGGRVKELRIRCLARKFLFIWVRRVYGRVTPSMARAHYNQHLLKSAFSCWYDIWWVARKEWRLMVRAECHHRYIIWRNMFGTWRDYIVKRRVRNTKKALAEQHGACKLTRKVLDAWIVYTDYRRHKKQRRHQAEQHWYLVSIRHVWRTWMYHLNVVEQRNQMEIIALQFWAQRIQSQHWLLWRSRISAKKAAILKHYKAIRHHNTVTVKRCLKNWLFYWARRRQKHKEKEYGLAVYQRSLVVKALRLWQEGYQLRKAVAEHEEKIETLAAQFQMRLVFVRWQRYIADIQESREKLVIASNHYQHQLKVMGLSAFRLAVVQRRTKLMRQELADQHRYITMMRWVWEHWLSRCDNNEELRLMTLTRRARKHYHRVICSKALTQLQEYCAWRIHRQRQYVQADAYYYTRVMPVYLFHMKVFVHLMKERRENEQKAGDFRRENLQARFYFLWCNQFQISREARMNERMAILHCDDTVVKRFFATWKQKTQQSLEDAEKETLATEHYCEQLVRSHLVAWKQLVEQRKQSQKNEVAASRHCCQKRLKKCLFAWRQYAVHGRLKQEKTDRARGHYGRLVCRKVWDMWLHYVDMQRLIQQRADVLYQAKCRQLLSETLLQWRSNVAMEIRERIAGQQAEYQHSHSLLYKVMKAWQRFAAIHAYKKSETQHWVVSAREQLDAGKLRVYFYKWRAVHQETVSDRHKAMVAVNHRARAVERQVLYAWKSFTQESIRKALLQKQSRWFHTVRLTARFFTQWKRAHTEALQTTEKTHLALWHWSLSLQRQVLFNWLLHTEERKRKKARIAAALERRHCRLLRDGVAQWLTVAHDMCNMRAKFAAQQQAKSAYETYQLVQRCALHWKHWTMRRREKRGGKLAAPQPGNTPRLPQQAEAPTSVTPRAGSDWPVVQFPAVRERQNLPVVHGPKPSSDLPVSVKNQPRARPRRPDFLVESLKRAGLYSASPDRQPSPSSVPAGVQEQTDSLPKASNIAEDNTQVGQAQMERLNLSNLSGESSESEPKLAGTPRDSRDTVPTAGTKGRQLPQQERQLSSQACLPPDWKPARLELLTPADFLCKRDGGPIPLSGQALDPSLLASKLQKETVLTGNHLLPGLGCISEPQSVASTPRVLCQDNGHSHPLSATYTLLPGDKQSGPSSREVTPRGNVLRDVTLAHNVQKGTQSQFDNTGKPSTQDVQREIIQIRNRLKSFDQKKKKLRTMEKQLQQLCDWLKDQGVTSQDQSLHDTDIINAQLEEQELRSDVESLRRSVAAEAGKCTGLVEHVKVLMSQLPV